MHMHQVRGYVRDGTQLEDRVFPSKVITIILHPLFHVGNQATRTHSTTCMRGSLHLFVINFAWRKSNYFSFRRQTTNNCCLLPTNRSSTMPPIPAASLVDPRQPSGEIFSYFWRCIGLMLWLRNTLLYWSCSQIVGKSVMKRTQARDFYVHTIDHGRAMFEKENTKIILHNS